MSMYLELRPVARPAAYGPEWDAYGLCDHRRWLSSAPGAGDDYPAERGIVRAFLRDDPFRDRDGGQVREDSVVRDGRRFVVFLLSHDPFRAAREPARQQRTIAVPTPRAA